MNRKYIGVIIYCSSLVLNRKYTNYTKRGTFFVKNGIKKGKGLDLGAEPTRITFVEYPPGF